MFGWVVLLVALSQANYLFVLRRAWLVHRGFGVVIAHPPVSEVDLYVPLRGGGCSCPRTGFLYSFKDSTHVSTDVVVLPVVCLGYSV